jgi:hypothetical protein
MKNQGENISTLAWTKADYENAKEEIPENLEEDDIHTEGELMNRDEIDSWVSDTYKTFCIFREQNPTIFEKLYNEFVLDVHYLQELGKITDSEAGAILNKDNYLF